mgnify:CR=1 FL=1
MNIGELFISLGFDVDDKKLKEFKEDLKDGLQSLLKMSAAATGALYGIDKFLDGAIETANEIRNIHNQTGLAEESIQRFGNVAKYVGGAGGLSSFLQSLDAVSAKITEVKSLGGNGAVFAILGLDVKNDDAVQIFDTLVKQVQAGQDKIYGNHQAWVQKVKELGFDPALLINAAKLSPEEYNKQFKSQIMSQEEINRLIEQGRRWNDFTEALRDFRNEIAAQYGDNFINFFKKLIPVIKDAVGWIKNINTALNTLGDFKWTALAVGIGTISLAFGVLTPEAVILAAALAGIAVSLEQIGEYMSQPGHNWSTWFKDAGNVIKQGANTALEWTGKAIGSGVTAINEAAVQSELENQGGFSIEKMLKGTLDLRYGSNQAMTEMNKPVQNTFHNLYNIHSVEDAFAIGNQIGAAQKRQINNTSQAIPATGF